MAEFDEAVKHNEQLRQNLGRGLCSSTFQLNLRRS